MQQGNFDEEEKPQASTGHQSDFAKSLCKIYGYKELRVPSDILTYRREGGYNPTGITGFKLEVSDQFTVCSSLLRRLLLE